MPDHLENIKEIISEEDLGTMLKLPKAIVYLLVKWSGQERISRGIVSKVLFEMRSIEKDIYKIDCSDQQNKYVEDWLVSQSHPYSYSNGYGEILLVINGTVQDYIRYPGQLGIENNKMKITEWLTTANIRLPKVCPK